jgi:hypothetical protein
MIPTVTHKFKDSRGKFRTQSLFREMEIPGYPAYYTLAADDIPPYLSLKRLYLDMQDPTEYLFAESYLGGWIHFQSMYKNCKWFRDEVDEWREELKVRMTSDAIRHMIELVANPKARDSVRLAAAKYLAEQGWKTDVKSAPKRGRPSNAEVQGELQRAARQRAILEDDAERIGVS